jgi:uncharacterized spore protein YtfJ
MAPVRAFRTLRRILGARQVFGKPVEREGVTVIPVATVIGGGGAGGGTDRSAEGGEGSGLGFGLVARPVGAFEVRDDGVRWRPAIGPTQLLAWGLLAALLVARWVLKASQPES